MSVDTSPDPANFDQTTGTELDSFPQPASHGASVMNQLNDLQADRDAPASDRATLYDQALSYWRKHVDDSDQEPYVAVDDFDAEWLPAGDFALVLTSSRWKAGTGTGDDYSAYYQQHLKLRRWGSDADGNPKLVKPALALHVEIMPQFRDMVYKSGDPLECPHGEGTRLVGWTTWADDPEQIERRMYDAVRAVYGADALDLADRNDDARRIQKAEAHIRFAIDRKKAAVETIEQTKQLIDWGGESEIEAHQKRQRQGWIESKFETDRWHLLGFDPQPYDTELKLYQASKWHKKPRSDPMHHPKLEASYAGVNDGELPHVEQWDEVMDHLRSVVATHARWAGIGPEHLVADDFYQGASEPRWQYQKPTGRREMLKRRYDDRATDIYREALKESTTAVYDILRVTAEESGATYDVLEERTGLARSTVRYHVRRLAEEDVVKRIGNPVLVVFVSRALLDRAREILREVRPEETAEDIDQRAEERRERRQERREERAEESDEADTGTDSDGGSNDWAYLCDLVGIDPDQFATAIEEGWIADDHVRVRTDPYDWVG